MQHKGSLKQSRRHGGIGRLNSSKFKYETLYTSGDSIKFSECQIPLRKCKAAYSENFLATVLV